MAQKAAVANGVPKQRAGILVDEQFGADILRDAAGEGLVTACPAEKSGQDEFDFEYGSALRKSPRAVQPDLLQGACALQHRGQQGPETGAKPSACESYRITFTRVGAATCSNCSCPPNRASFSATAATGRPTTSSSARP